MADWESLRQEVLRPRHRRKSIGAKMRDGRSPQAIKPARLARHAVEHARLLDNSGLGHPNFAIGSTKAEADGKYI